MGVGAVSAGGAEPDRPGRPRTSRRRGRRTPRSRRAVPTPAAGESDGADGDHHDRAGGRGDGEEIGGRGHPGDPQAPARGRDAIARMKRSASGRAAAPQRGGAGGGPSGTRVHRLGTAGRLTQRGAATKRFQGTANPGGRVSGARGGAALTSLMRAHHHAWNNRPQLTITLDPRGRVA